jgi:hypothetical protein
MKWIAIITSHLAVAGIVAFLCLGTPSVQAQPNEDRFELGYQTGYAAGYEQGNTDSVEYREVVRYEEREVVREVTINRTISLRDFASTEELTGWLAADDTNEFVYLFTDQAGIARTSDRFDCDDYARQLQQRAADSGYLMSLAIVDGTDGPHMINLVIIDGGIYHVEPQTDEFWRYSELD